MAAVLYETGTDYTSRAHGFTIVFLLGPCCPSVLCCVVFFLSSSSVFYAQCCQYLFIVHSFFFFIAPSGFTNVYLQFLNNVIFIKTTVLLHQSYMVFSDFLSVIYLRFEYIIEVLIYGSPAYVLY
jgi:hypothetical protein